MLGGGRRRRGLGALAGGGVALGLLGVAMEAVEHYMGQKGAAGKSAPPPPPPAAAPPPPPPAAPDKGSDAAVLLIRAMIAAAHADGQIDEIERRRIFERLQGCQLSEEERRFLDQELAAPADLETIADQVQTRRMAEEVYAASLLAIDVDTEAEKRYLQALAERIGLDPETVERIHRKLEG